MRKLFVGLSLACIGLSCFVATAAAKPAPTQLSIRPFPEGVFGYIGSSNAESCASGRVIVVYSSTGDEPDPDHDRKVGSARAGKAEGFQWTRKTGSGRFYALAAATADCAAALSRTVETRTDPLGTAGAEGAYPLCGPYASEGSSEICRLPQLYMALTREAALHPCRFGNDSGDCEGAARDAPAPWGHLVNGADPAARVLWHPEGSVRALDLLSYPNGTAQGSAAAYLNGTVPDSGSARFTVSDGFAENEDGYPAGDHFFTPDLPGQGAGEVGGPLHLNFKNGDWRDPGAELWVNGYLYLKH
jgi:hypothetical protein